MNSTKFEINVAHKGIHDFTVTIDRNGPSDAPIQTASFVLNLLRAELGDDYSLDLTMVKSSVYRSSI